MKSLSIFSMFISTSLFAQSNIPQSVMALGSKFSSSYLAFSQNVRAIKSSMPVNSVSNAEDLYSRSNNEWNNLTNSNTTNFVTAMPSNLSVMISRNNYSVNSIAINNLSPDVMNIVSRIMQGIDTLTEGVGFDNYFLAYANQVTTSTTLSSYDKDVISYLIMSLNISTEIIIDDFAVRDTINSGTGRRSWWDAFKCAAGTVGGAVLGGIAGAGVGTVALPLIGTVSGAAVGFYGGALVGMAASC